MSHLFVTAVALLLCAVVCPAAVFNVKDFGATGRKADDARGAIQKAVEACAAEGGGTVLIPAGDYTTGTIHLRSRVRIEIAAGATVYASLDPAAYDYGNVLSKAAVFFGEDVEQVAIVGEGTVHGQAEYEWRDDDFEQSFDHKVWMTQAGKPIRRSFPKDMKTRTVYPHLVWLGRARDVLFRGVKWLHSPSWSLTLYDCERVRFEGLYVHTSLKEGVWADGIDMDSCRDVTISDCRIETGDDCVVFISTPVWGPAKRCENITVTRSVLSSASAGVKFSEGNYAGVRNVRITDCVLTNVNRGFVFYAMRGGDVSDVVVSNVTIYCNRFDWFWVGTGQPFHFRVGRHSDFTRQPRKPDEPHPGRIRDVTIRNVVAHGKGTSRLHGHAESPLEGLRLENVTLTMSYDPAAPFERADHALELRRARDVSISGLEVRWLSPTWTGWAHAVYAEDVSGLALERFVGRGATLTNAAVVLANVRESAVQRSQAVVGTGAFVQVRGTNSALIRLEQNDVRRARVGLVAEPEVTAGAVVVR